MIHIDVGSVRATILNMDKTVFTETQAATTAIAAAGAEYFDRVRQNIGLRDHSLADLARQDHPYARRHGSIGIHGSDGAPLVHPAFQVHQQSGTLLNATTGRMRVERGQPTYTVKMDTGLAPHAVYVVSGTRVMLARDVLWDTALHQPNRIAIMKRIIRVLGPAMRTKAIIRFTPTFRPALPGGRVEV